MQVHGEATVPERQDAHNMRRSGVAAIRTHLSARRVRRAGGEGILRGDVPPLLPDTVGNLPVVWFRMPSTKGNLAQGDSELLLHGRGEKRPREPGHPWRL